MINISSKGGSTQVGYDFESFFNDLKDLKSSEKFEFFIDDVFPSAGNCLRIRFNNLRRRRGKLAEMCPITAVCYWKTGKRFFDSDFDKAAEAIGLPAEDREHIATTADNFEGDDEFIPELRTRLLTFWEI